MVTKSPAVMHYICEECDKTFATRYNLDRHEAAFHNEDSCPDSEEEESESESEEVAEESIKDDDSSEIDEEESVEDDDSSEIDEEENDSLRAAQERVCNGVDQELIDEVEDCIEDLQSSNGMDLDEAKAVALKKFSKRLDKSYRNSLVEFLIQSRVLQKCPRVALVISKARSLEKKGFDADSALWAAMSRRKHLFRPFRRHQRHLKTL